MQHLGNYLEVLNSKITAILGKGPWPELGGNMQHFGNFFRSVKQ